MFVFYVWLSYQSRNIFGSVVRNTDRRMTLELQMVELKHFDAPWWWAAVYAINPPWMKGSGMCSPSLLMSVIWTDRCQTWTVDMQLWGSKLSLSVCNEWTFIMFINLFFNALQEMTLSMYTSHQLLPAIVLPPWLSLSF